MYKYTHIIYSSSYTEFILRFYTLIGIKTEFILQNSAT
jgi:hypothetical protein